MEFCNYSANSYYGKWQIADNIDKVGNCKPLPVVG